MSIKEKVSEYDKDKKEGFVLEKIYFFVNPEILNEEWKIYRMEKCENKGERECWKTLFCYCSRRIYFRDDIKSKKI